MKNKVSPSPETQQEALKIAKATQKPGQTKEQTKLIAQGIEKGIAQYKKQQKEKARQADKAKKKARKVQQTQLEVEPDMRPERPLSTANHSRFPFIPWTLLVVSWLGFIFYAVSTGGGGFFHHPCFSVATIIGKFFRSVGQVFAMVRVFNTKMTIPCGKSRNGHKRGAE